MAVRGAEVGMASGPQVRRKHQWVIMASYVLSYETAELISEGTLDVGDGVDFSSERRLVGPVCYHCEVPFPSAGPSCPGDMFDG